MATENKLETLLGIEGIGSVEEFAEQFISESCVPGICMNEGCDFTISYEPDQDRGWCDECETNTVKSGFVLMGII